MSGLVDDFRLVFTKGRGERVRVAVAKADSRELGISASAGITVGFARETDVAEAVTNLLESIAGEPISRISSALSKGEQKNSPLKTG